MKTIGLAIPCYIHHISKLNNLLNSLELQTKKPDYVVVSCSSTKPENLTIDTASFTFPVEIIIFPKRKNAAENRNIATRHLIQKYNVDFISYFDADDIMHPQRLEAIYNGFIIYDSNIILHSYYKSDENNIEFENYSDFHYYENKLKPILTGYKHGVYFENNRIHHSQVSVKKEVFAEIFFQEKKKVERTEDSRFCNRVMKSHFGEKNLYISNKLSKYYKEGMWHKC